MTTNPTQKAGVMALLMIAAYVAGIMSMPVFLFGVLASKYNPYFGFCLAIYGGMGMVFSAVFLFFATKLLGNMNKVKWK